MAEEELILLAKIRKAHGLKGEVLLQSFTMDDNRFKKLKRVFLRDEKRQVTEREIESVRSTAQGVLMKFIGVDDRDQADELQFREVMVPISEREKLPEGQAYYDQIIGMDVVDDETDEKIAVIRDIMELPAGDVYILTMLDGSEHLLASAGEEVKKLDTKKNTLRVTLLEEY